MANTLEAISQAVVRTLHREMAWSELCVQVTHMSADSGFVRDKKGAREIAEKSMLNPGVRYRDLS